MELNTGLKEWKCHSVWSTCLTWPRLYTGCPSRYKPLNLFSLDNSTRSTLKASVDFRYCMCLNPVKRGWLFLLLISSNNLGFFSHRANRNLVHSLTTAAQQMCFVLQIEQILWTWWWNPQSWDQLLPYDTLDLAPYLGTSWAPNWSSYNEACVLLAFKFNMQFFCIYVLPWQVGRCICFLEKTHSID